MIAENCASMNSIVDVSIQIRQISKQTFPNKRNSSERFSVKNFLNEMFIHTPLVTLKLSQQHQNRKQNKEADKHIVSGWNVKKSFAD